MDHNGRWFVDQLPLAAWTKVDITDIQRESKKSPPPRGPDIFSFFSQTVENLYVIDFLHTY